MYFAVNFCFNKDFVLPRLCLKIMSLLFTCYLYAWTNKVQISFVPETRYVSCTGLLFNKRKNVHIARCYSHST